MSDKGAGGEMKLNHLIFRLNLRRILEDLEITQTDFSARCGLTQANLSQILNGDRQPSIKTICKILNVLPVSFERLTADKTQ